MSENTELLTLANGIMAVQDLIDNSFGVTGLHLNGDYAPWGELRTGGRFEDWLAAFDAAVEAARRVRLEAARNTKRVVPAPTNEGTP